MCTCLCVCTRACYMVSNLLSVQWCSSLGAQKTCGPEGSTFPPPVSSSAQSACPGGLCWELTLVCLCITFLCRGVFPLYASQDEIFHRVRQFKCTFQMKILLPRELVVRWPVCFEQKIKCMWGIFLYYYYRLIWKEIYLSIPVMMRSSCILSVACSCGLM